MYKKGDIVLVPFPFTDLSGQKIRPALIVTSTSKDSDVIVIFITSNIKLKIKDSVPILPSTQNGIKVSSGIVCSKIATLDRNIILGKIGFIENFVQNKVDVSLKKVLGLK